ncbi:MAG: hypothetical protein EP330_26500 [Deltaproteobacteria bacterium]|nr:MAG: hypothetical protein EP330_26500 [Deltaproteobacteria bacterium]
MSSRLQRISDAIGRVLPPWRRWSSRQRMHALLVFALMLASIGHQLVFVYWYIEDAAISFTYARNFAEGEGFVTYPGGERVEGFSDPLWVYLMILWEYVGVSGFTSSKVMGAVFGALCLPVSYLLAQEALRTHTSNQWWSDEPDHYGLIAPAYLAASAQFAIWNASGLENSLFCLLLAMGMWRTQIETRTNGWPTAALYFFGLSITRPEGILYAALGGFWAMVLSLMKHRSPALTVKWLAFFFAPFSAYQALRYSYFAWPFPNTYYAKLGDKDFLPFAWHARGWKYIRDWAHLLWHGYLLPVYLLGLIGKRPGAKLTVLGAVLVVLALMLPGPDLVKGFWPWRSFQIPSGWNETRVWLLLLLTSLLFVRGFGREGWRVRLLAGGMTFIALFFSLWSGGDWMKGYRWMSLLTVPMAVLFAVGSAQMAPLLGQVLAPVWVPLVTGLRVLARRGKLTRPQIRHGFVAAGVVALLGCVIGPNAYHSDWFARKPETGPFSVQKRVQYVNWVERRLHLLYRPTTFDVDMGANMYWSGNKIGDVAGLVDVPMGHHNYQTAFMKEYVFSELKPDFVHSHGGWASRSGVQNHPEWRERYFEIPGYPTGATGLHIGNWVKKSLFIDDRWPVDDTSGELSFGHGIRITGVDTHLPVAPDEHLYLEIGLKLDVLPEGKRDEDWEVRILAFISNGTRLHTWDLPPGYDWYRPSDMQPGETFHGRFSLKVPGNFEPGSYDLGLVVIGPDGAAPALLSAGEAAIHAGIEGFEPWMAKSEVRFPGAITVLPLTEALDQARAKVDDVVSLSESGDCEGAEAAWVEAQRRTTRRDGFARNHRDTATTALAGCYVARAEATEDQDERTKWLIAAKEHDHHHEGYKHLATRHGELLYQEGHIARAEIDSEEIVSEDWDRPYRLFTDSVLVDPSRSWSRRYAEEARDFRLGIDPISTAQAQKKREEEAEQRRKERAEAAEQRRKEREAAREAGEEGEPGEEGEGTEDNEAEREEARKEGWPVPPEVAPPPIGPGGRPMLPRTKVIKRKGDDPGTPE